MKIGEIWTSRFWFLFFVKNEKGGIRSREFYLEVCKQAVILKILVQIRSVQPYETNSLSLVQTSSQVNLAQCTLCWQFED